MSMRLEHDYIGLSSEVPPMESSDKKFSAGGLHLKATELRLGLPGSESPERENGNSQLSIGAKRGFSVAIHGGSANWVFSGSPGSEPDFSPRAANAGKVITGSDSVPVSKDGLPQSPKPIAQEKKNQILGVNGHGVAAASKAQVVGWPPIRSFRKNTMASHTPKNDDDAEAKLGSGFLYIKVSMDGAPYLRKVDLKTHGSYTELSSALEKMFSCFTIDKDGDWMLVGDVPWKMFTDSCRRLRIMKSSEAIGLAQEPWRSVKVATSEIVLLSTDQIHCLGK
ncbi:hypothetical protein GH714_024780 [Hevea brasiliensis]|uniref:Auxin-responsive protein n=1 Tax=Hevea brasiliensis TaxID=3981 RepID=A0A6A6LR85_HEVBR|nr:hypothetical protein GH714_024780 [Hevea brasiliensis]